MYREFNGENTIKDLSNIVGSCSEIVQFLRKFLSRNPQLAAQILQSMHRYLQYEVDSSCSDYT